MVLTRSASSSPVKKNVRASKPLTKPEVNITKTTAPLTQAEPLRVIIAPKSLSPAVRFISLSNPVTREPERFLFCPENGLHGLTKTSTPKHNPHSILFTAQDIELPAKRDDDAISNGYVNKLAEYLTATPYDLSFVILPLLTGSAKSSLFQTVDDIIETSEVKTYDLLYILRKSRSIFEEAILRICDVIEAGDESLYRYSSSKTLQLLIARAKRACENGLPASLEDRFVTRVLETPMLSVKREESTISLVTTESQDIPLEENTQVDTSDSQSTTTSVAPSVVFSESATTTTSMTTTTSEATITTSVPTESPSSEVVSLQRFLTAFKFIAHSYLPSSTASIILASLQDPSSGIDFSLLTTYLAHVTELRAEAAASMDLSSFSRKRGIEDDVEAEERAEKKRKLEEEEKRKKASQSRGVKELSKVDVKGMKKMSSFFTKMPAKKG